MNSAQQSANEQIQHVFHMQSKAFQPMRRFSDLAAEAMEQVVRKNYAVMGDFVEFSVKQAQFPLNGDNARDILSAQMEELSTFGVLMNRRASEYVALVSTLSEHARKATDNAAAQVCEVAVEQTKRAIETAVVYTQQATDEVGNNVQKAADNVKSASNRTKKTATSAKKSA